MLTLLTMILKRLALGLLTLFFVSIVIFFSVELLPGDIAQEILGQSATPETLAALREDLGLNEPALVRYAMWLGDFVTGDFGVSLANGRNISEILTVRFGNTLFLAAYAAVIAVPLAVSLGIVVALYRETIVDRLANIATLSLVSFPEFFVAYILILFLSVKLGWFPTLANVSENTTFGERLYLLFLPALTLTLIVMAHMMRMTRAAIINLLSSPYIEMAILKGVSPLRLLVTHALPNALSPIINVVALNLAFLITGVVLVEVVFVYPGLGQLLVDSVSKRDLPVVQASCLAFAMTYILLNLIADVLSIATNPRLLHRR